MSASSPPWSLTTKRLVSVLLLALLVFVLFRFPTMVRALLLGCLLAYLLSPIAERLIKRTKWKRWIGALLVHGLALAVILLAAAILIPASLNAARDFKIDFTQIQDTIENLLANPIVLGDQTIDMSAALQRLNENLSGMLQPLLASAVDVLVDLAQGLITLALTVVISFYLLKDAPRINTALENFTPAPYRGDFVQLRSRIARIWQAFFRGQLVLCVVMGVVVGVSMRLLGVRNSLLIGFLFGILEVVPNFGPIIASIPTLAIAFFTGSTWLPVDNFVFTAIVLVVLIALQQLENIVLTPRIMGHHLKLHPVVVLLGALAGASLAGVLGVLLAAPMIATARIVGQYVYGKLFDLEPFPSEAL
jgi:predicted PurR-regulated permease PerM